MTTLFLVVFAFVPASLAQNCNDGMPNGQFFDEHVDPNRPCYSHVCYPADDAPFYQRVERFLVDKCCKHGDEDIVYGTEVRTPLSQCSLEAVTCSRPLEGDAEMLPIVNQLTTCCNFNGQIIMPNEEKQDFETCSKIQCTSDYELIHQQIFFTGCCNFNGTMMEESTMTTDQSHICFGEQVYEVVNRVNFRSTGMFPAMFVDDGADFNSLTSIVRSLAQEEKAALKPCLYDNSLFNCVGMLRKKRSVSDE